MQAETERPMAARQRESALVRTTHTKFPSDGERQQILVRNDCGSQIHIIKLKESYIQIKEDRKNNPIMRTLIQLIQYSMK